jgi:hypothetical protein
VVAPTSRGSVRTDRVRLAGILVLATLAFLALFATAYATRPTLTLNLAGDSRATLRDFYAVEHFDALSWVWTHPRAELSLPNLDRGVAWRWSSRVLLNRPTDIPSTVLRIAIDDVVAFEGIVTHDSQLDFVVPPVRGLTGLTLTFDTSPVFVPGSGDPRELGVALASVSLSAERGSAPKTDVLLYGLLAMGAIWVAFIVQRLRPAAILAGLLAATIGHAWLLMRDVTVHGPYPSTVVILAAGIWLGIALFARVVDSLPVALSKILPETKTRAGLFPAQLSRRVLDSIPELLLSPTRRFLTGAAYVLPVLLVINAAGFWGHGVIDEEAMFFVLNYLADRPLIARIFDPLLNDWGAYQAREVSYVFDLIDARVFASLLDRGVLFFIPLSGVLGLVAVGAVHMWGSRKVLRLDGVTASLLLSLFLSCIVTQASTAIFYRSSKIALSVALLAFLFHLTSLVRATGETRRASLPRLVVLFLLGLVMSITDRQGFFYLACATAIVTGLWMAAHLRGAAVRTSHARILATSLGALAGATLYNRVMAPAVIRWANGYSPGFEYQQLDLAGLLDATLVDQAWTMFQAQASFFFGNLPFALLGLVAAIAWVASVSRSRMHSHGGGTTVTTLLTDDRLLVTLGSASALVVLLALMILRHPPVYSIPDHAFWYYTLTLHVVFLFGLSLAITALGRPGHIRGKGLIRAVLVAMIVGNVSHYTDQRRTVTDSGRFGNQSERSRRMVEGYEAASDAGTGRILDPASSGPYLAEVDHDEEHFLERVQIAHAKLTGR